MRKITLAGLQSFFKEQIIDHILDANGFSVWQTRYVFFFVKANQHAPHTNLQVISPKLLEAHDHKHHNKRVFLSEEKDVNMIDSIISKVNIVYVDPNVSHLFFLTSYECLLHTACHISADLVCCCWVIQLQETPQTKDQLISNSDLYYDMYYSVAYSTFANLSTGNHF